MRPNGVVFLPAAGYRIGMNFSSETRNIAQYLVEMGSTTDLTANQNIPE